LLQFRDFLFRFGDLLIDEFQEAKIATRVRLIRLLPFGRHGPLDPPIRNAKHPVRFAISWRCERGPSTFRNATSCTQCLG
jgi:hypothetical protein